MMQASKIKPGSHKHYAIMHEGKLVRFHVSAVVTRRTKSTGSPHDYTSEVEGAIVVPDTGTGEALQLTLDPDRILGEYDEHAELVAREKAEQAIRDAQMKARKAKVERAFFALYERTGLGLPVGDLTKHGLPFRLGYNGETIDIGREGVEALLKFFGVEA